MKFSLLCLILGASLASVAATENVLICYYGSWAHYRPGNGKVSVEHLDPNLCTHLVYTFVGINGLGEVVILDDWLDRELKNFEKFVGLREVNPNLKLLVAIGGWSQRSEKFSSVTADATLRARFVRNAVEFTKKHGFDGFDLDWEYPGDPNQGGRPEDKANFILLLKELRKEFDAENLLLTAAVGSTKSHRANSYHVREMSKYLHYINVMSYDLHGSWDHKTGHNSPLYAHSSDSKPDLNVDQVIQDWINEGADPRKLVLGLGFYGRSFTLSDRNNFAVGAPTSGPGLQGPYTREGGSLSYQEICYKLKYDNWNYAWIDEQQSPIAYSGDQWVGFDDVRSLELKVDLVKKYNLGGVMLWSIEQDDIPNDCGDGPYPLLTAVNRRLGRSFVTTPSVPRPTTQSPTTLPPGVTHAPGTGECSQAGTFSYANDCTRFYICDAAGNKSNYNCPPGTKFDNAIGTCNFAHLVTSC